VAGGNLGVAMGARMIVLMDGVYHDISVGLREYKDVSRATWGCWLKLFRWFFEEGVGTPLLFQGGWGVKIDEISSAESQNSPRLSEIVRNSPNSAAEQGESNV
jgi:hypothetical protein